MSREQTDIRTKDGLCTASVFRPEGSGTWPAVIFFMDGSACRAQHQHHGQFCRGVG